MTDSTQRFSSRVDNYIKYRPGYPAAVIELLRRECGLSSETVVADVGSGTGILSELFLKNGNTVFAIEPNLEMREASERLLGNYPGFKSVAAAAESTTLSDRSVDLITAAQAFHWFDRTKAREEFLRILKPGGCVALIWNERSATSTPFLKAFEELLVKYAPEYSVVDHRQINDEIIGEFFHPGKVAKATFLNTQNFDFESLKGRLASASYAPEPGHENYAPMQLKLREIFDAHAIDQKIDFEYETVVYYGKLS